MKTCVQLMPSWLGLPVVAAKIGDTMFLSSNLCTACAEEHQNLRLIHSVSFSCLDELTKCFPCFKIPRPLLCWIFINGVYLETNFTVERLTGKDMTTGLKKTLAKGCNHCTCLWKCIWTSMQESKERNADLNNNSLTCVCITCKSWEQCWLLIYPAPHQ